MPEMEQNITVSNIPYDRQLMKRTNYNSLQKVAKKTHTQIFKK